MSAYLVNKITIDAIVTFAMAHMHSMKPLPGDGNQRYVITKNENPDKIGLALWSENQISVDCRYRETTRTLTYKWSPKIQGRVDATTTRILTPMDIIGLCHCLKYQSCEHDGWEASWACDFLKKVVDAATRKLPGYDKAPWGLRD